MQATYDRVARLEELRQDMTGWDYLDLGTLLSSWHFRSRPLGVSYGRNNLLAESVLWYYPDDPGRLNVVLPSEDGIAESIVQRIVWVIDAARSLGAP
jgi:hypothetical protein